MQPGILGKYTAAQEDPVFQLYKLLSAQGAENQEKRLYNIPYTQIYLPVINIKIT